MRPGKDKSQAPFPPQKEDGEGLPPGEAVKPKSTDAHSASPEFGNEFKHEEATRPGELWPESHFEALLRQRILFSRYLMSWDRFLLLSEFSKNNMA